MTEPMSANETPRVSEERLCELAAMSDGPVPCPRCGVPFQFTLERGYECSPCHIAWDAKFPVAEHITTHDEEPDYDDDGNDERCLWCGGEGFKFGDEMGDPLWYDADEAYPCPSCHGTGLRKDMTLW